MGCSFWNVLVYVPESTVIGRIDDHAAVISPTIGIGGRPLGNENRRNALHLIQWVAGHSSGKSERRMQGCTVGFAETERNVAGLVHGNTAHPQRVVAFGDRTLLEYFRGSVRIAYFIPTFARSRFAGHNGMAPDQSLVVAKIPVSEPEHDAITQRVELLRRAWLRNASAAPASHCVGLYWDRNRPLECGFRRLREVHMEAEQM